ncbi:FtsX-like permease family protein [Flavobacterium sp. MXW15]|uniref:FtsX-like permease family protein n=1 Tax=Xanthomonas chitinilytica TaxID=2989819 RepID=A0ABT3K029_9XANT|nr:FtsX-like permease family protein [Xanthomonas sp. H13-6]MCW4456382.1 FtsX-like permease family protein [Flavobacterium sp. MXW15]MCW4474087.1 FtsX-like permease family protein [Xanthomonas sp. H13-6]
MKYFSLIWAQLFRSKTRTLLTLLSVVAAFLLFGLLDSVRVAFNAGASVAGADRLVVASRLSITQMLPLSLERQIAAVPGVRAVSYGNWFGGIYQDPKNFFPNFVIGPGYMQLYPEYAVAPEQMQAFEADRTGALVGESLAKRFGWKIGDTIPLEATIFPQKDGSNSWPLTLRGTFSVADSKRKGEETALYFHWKYFDEANAYMSGMVGFYVVSLDNPEHADRVSRAIDAISANSANETKTQTEQAFNQAFIKQFADIGLIVSAIMAAVFFTLLLLTGNTMAQAVRERIPELAVLKTLGFTNRTVLMLVLVEAIVLIVLGGVIGLGTAALLIPLLSAGSGGVIQLPTVQAETWLLGLLLMVAIGTVVGLLPAIRAMRLKIVDALAGR